MATAKSASARAPLARLPAATGHSARPHLLLTPWSPTAHPPRPNKRTTRHPGEVAEERLLAYWPQRGSGPAGDEVVSQFNEHRYYLSPLLPPASFMADPTSVPERGLLRLKGVRSVLHMAGRLLGGADELTERRWEHLADGVLLKELCSHLVHEHIKPLGPYGKGEELALTRLCIPGGCVHAFPLSSTCLPSYSIHPSLRPSIHPSPTPPRALSSLLSSLPSHAHTTRTRAHTPLAQEQVVARARHEALGSPARSRGAPRPPARRERAGVPPSLLARVRAAPPSRLSQPQTRNPAASPPLPRLCPASSVAALPLPPHTSTRLRLPSSTLSPLLLWQRCVGVERAPLQARCTRPFALPHAFAPQPARLHTRRLAARPKRPRGGSCG